MACRTPTPASGAIVRLPTPVITAEELLAEIAAGVPGPADSRQALELAATVMEEALKNVLENFPYRDRPTDPAAVWARVLALALERCRSALSREDYTRLEMCRILDAAFAEAKGRAS